MEFSSIWFFLISSLISLVFLSTGVYCLDKAILISLPHDWFIHQIQAWIASSVMFSISYAFLFRPPLEHQELDAADRKLIMLYGFHPQLINSLLFPFFSFYNFFRFHKKINLILPLFCLPLILWFFYYSSKYFKTHGNGNGNRNFLVRIANPFLLYPYHSLCWISFIVSMFFSLCANFEDKYSLIFPSGVCLSIWGFYSYISSVLQSISILDCMVFVKNFRMPKSSILTFAYEQRKMFEIILDLLFVILSQYFSREKSLPLMFAFISFAITWLGNLANVQPITDLGIFHFFVSSTMECAMSLFGFHVYTFLVLFGCIVLEILRWKIEFVSLRHTGIREDIFLDWLCLGQSKSSPAVVARDQESVPPEGNRKPKNASSVTVKQPISTFNSDQKM